MTKELAPIEEVRSSLTKMAPQFKMALPAHVTTDRFVRITMTAIQQNRGLLTANRDSLYGACMKSAQDGLVPDGREAALVIYETKKGPMVSYQPMVAGIAKRARNSGHIKTMNAEVVYSMDEYNHWSDETGEHFKHVKARANRGEPILTYAYAITKDDGFFFEEIDEMTMEKIKNVSKAKNGPWSGPFKDEMRRKSALKRLAKYRLPSSADLDGMLQRDDEMEEKEVEEIKPKTKSLRLANLIETEEVDTSTGEIEDPEIMKEKKKPGRPKKEDLEPADYVIKFTKGFGGKKIKELSPENIKKLMKWCEDNKAFPDYVEAASTYLDTIEAPIEKEVQPVAEETTEKSEFETFNEDDF